MDYYGPRTLLNILAGATLATLWLLLVPSLTGEQEVSGTAQLLAALSWSAAIVYLLSYRFPGLRRWMRLPVTLPIVAAAVALGYFSVGTEQGRSEAFWLSSCVLVPVSLLAGPLAISSLASQLQRQPWFRENFCSGDGDSATWANRGEYHAREMQLPRTKEGKLGWTDRILLGATTFRHDFMPRLVGIKTGVHLCTVGMTNSGKSATAQWPNYAMYGGAGLIIDMKGEHAQVTGRRRSELGPVSVFDPLQVTGLPSATCNVLAGIDETTDDGLIQIAEIRQALILPEKNAASGPHFADNAGTLLEGVITWVCHTQPPELRNLATVYRIIESRDPETGVYDEQVWSNAIYEMSNCPVGQCVPAAKLMVDAAEEEGGSFKTTLSKSLKWMAGKGMQSFLSGVENPLLELPTLGAEKPTIYVVVGVGNEKNYTRYIRLMAAMGVYYLRRDFRRTLQKPSPSVLVGLDEYPLYAEGLDSISDGFGNLREAGCMLWVGAQKISQIKNAIGQEPCSLLLQSSTVQVFGVNNDGEDVAAWVSGELGKRVVKKREGWGPLAKEVGEKTVPLMTYREVEDTLRQHAANQFVFPADGGPPMWLHRRAYKDFRIDGKRCFQPLPLGDVFEERRNAAPVPADRS
ncbi:type IV secretory system conjugative DNA transfer family protein [Botrimarina hoheduenensis]|uniref:Type IV secretory system Conjugative DNA transfer n=1 Tax=Botrimarina hoheduenensis TaxID=2528000 RepID=A0A5C5WDF4_9BACT|nr:type IV secretory system conjugative DNA transfer family protein [Botrimarina hoheduenensis]TWT48928.1 Type IV secretory system Conjugative DNA transfer [Botrimarina hoheduenensis]